MNFSNDCIKKKLADLTKDEICNSAFEVIRAKGHPNCTIKDFARQAGVSVGTVYNHFEDKQSLLYHSHRKVSMHLLEKCKSNIGTNTSPLAKLSKIINGFSLFHHEYAFVYNVVVPGQSHAVLKQKALENFTQTAALIRTVLQEGISENQREEIDSRSVAQLIMLTCIGTVILNSLSEPGALCKYPFESLCSMISKRQGDGRADCGAKEKS